jgi:antitoxin HicB
MQAWTYPAHLEDHGEDGFAVTFRDFPAAITGAGDRAEAIELAADALGVAVREYLATGRRIPAPHSADEGSEDIPLDPLTAARALLARTMQAQGLTNVALAGRMGKAEGQVRRMLDGRGSVRIEGVMAALHVLGVFPTLAV